MEIISKNKITLKLVAGKKWRADAGFIIAKTVNIAGKTYPLAGLDGKWSVTFTLLLSYNFFVVFVNSDGVGFVALILYPLSLTIRMTFESGYLRSTDLRLFDSFAGCVYMT
jgi:hypothetical protein